MRRMRPRLHALDTNDWAASSADRPSKAASAAAWSGSDSADADTDGEAVSLGAPPEPVGGLATEPAAAGEPATEPRGPRAGTAGLAAPEACSVHN